MLFAFCSPLFCFAKYPKLGLTWAPGLVGSIQVEGPTWKGGERSMFKTDASGMCLGTEDWKGLARLLDMFLQDQAELSSGLDLACIRHVRSMVQELLDPA